MNHWLIVIAIAIIVRLQVQNSNYRAERTQGTYLPPTRLKLLCVSMK